MKKLFAFMLLLLGPVQGLYAQEPYAVLSADNTMLTFYYDNNKETKGGMDVGPFTYNHGVNSGWYNQRKNITTVEFDKSFAGCNTITSTAYWFYGFYKLETIKGVENLNTENVTDMTNMFSNCSGLTSLDVSKFNTANVTDMSCMFYDCSALTSLDVSKFNTANVTDMSCMFYDCSAFTSLDISRFDTANVTDMGGMFCGCSGLAKLDLSNFDTKNVTSMYHMFSGCRFLCAIYVREPWNTNKVEQSSSMFSKCEYLIGRKGTAASDYSDTDITYARIDGGDDAPGFFTDIADFDKPLERSYVVYNSNNSTLTFKYGDLPVNGDVVFADEQYQILSLRGAEDNPTREVIFSDKTHVYSNDALGSDSTYTDWCFLNIQKVIIDPSYANVRPKLTNRWFYFIRRSSREITGLNYLNTSEVENMRGMFINCGFTNLDLKNFNTAKVSDMSGMFYGCSGLTSLDVSNFNTANVTNMRSMFSGCSSLTNLDVSKFNSANVTDMGGMFSGCSGLTSLDVTNFNTANVTSMYRMFSGCSGLTSLDVSKFNTANVTDMGGMFSGCSGLTSLNVSKFNTANVTDMRGMFSGCSALSTIYCKETWSCENSDNMFNGCIFLDGAICYDDNKTNATYANPTDGYFYSADIIVFRPYALLSEDNTTLTFYYDVNKRAKGGMSVVPFTYDLSSGVNSIWYDQRENITKVVFDDSFADCTSIISTACWFYGCSNLTSITGMEKLNTSNVTDMSRMFYGCSGLKSLDVSNFNTANVTIMRSMFSGCSSLTNLNVSKFNSANVTDMSQMFSGCSGLTNLDVTNFNTDNVTSMYRMFSGCSGLTSLDVSKINTANVTSMNRMFYGCTGLTSLNVSKFNTANVTNMTNMFSGCSGLTSLDVSKFNTANVTNMTNMFSGCSGLTTIYCNDEWNCNDSESMFYDCTSLKGAISYDSEKTNVTYANPTTGYFTYKMLTPMEDQEEVNFGKNDDLNEETNLGGTVIDNVYFNISPENGSYDANNNCVVVSKAMTDGEIETVFGKDLLSDEVKNTFAGMVIKVAGKGKVTVEAQTTGGMTLKVKIGSAEPMEMELEGKLKMKFPYNVTEPTYVYIYAGKPSAESRRYYGSRCEGASLKIYGISVSTESYLKGDANGDGVITDADVTAVKDYIMGNKPENFVFEGADANEDGKINVADIVIILNKKE